MLVWPTAGWVFCGLAPCSPQLAPSTCSPNFPVPPPTGVASEWVPATGGGVLNCGTPVQSLTQLAQASKPAVCAHLYTQLVQLNVQYMQFVMCF